MSKKGNPTQVITITRSGDTVVANVTDVYARVVEGVTGAARCHPNDTFDFYEGARIALARAFGKDPFEKPSSAKLTGQEVLGNGKWVQATRQKPGRVGDWIKITEPWGTGGLYKKGDILQIQRLEPGHFGCFTRIKDNEKYISVSEYFVWVPENRSAEPKKESADKDLENAGHWVKATTGNLGLPGNLIRIDNPFLTDGLYNRGDVLVIAEAHPFGCWVHFVGQKGGRKLILMSEYSIWVPACKAVATQLACEPETEPAPLVPDFKVGDIVKTGGDPFASDCRNCTARVDSVQVGTDRVNYSLNVRKLNGNMVPQGCAQFRNMPVPMTLLWREEK